MPLTPAASASPAVTFEVQLPQRELKFPIRANDVTVKRVIGGWQVWAGQTVLRDLGDRENDARDLVSVYRDLRPTERVTIGGPKPIVEYGLTNGRPATTAGGTPDGKADSGPGGFNGPLVTGAGAKLVRTIDMKSARVEQVRGVWCVRDDDSILFNFGADKPGAEQTVAVIRKYGFNRIGVVGQAAQPVMNYLFVSLGADQAKPFGGQLQLQAQIESLTRTGIPVPGIGFAGEMVKIDPQKVQVRQVGAEWVVAAGSEVLGRFGRSEWSAREAARAVRDARFTEFCKLGGTSGLTFFLADGTAPARAPFNAQGRNFDVTSLKVQQINQRWAVTEGNKHLFDVSGPKEGEVVIRVLKHYGFAQIAHLSAGGAKGGITFLVKNR